jgi:hypothetical protein
MEKITMLSYAKWKLLNESLAGPRTLGLGYPTNLGVVGGAAKSESQHKMKFMFGDEGGKDGGKEGGGDMPFKPKKKKGPPMPLPKGHGHEEDLGDEEEDGHGPDLDSDMDGDDFHGPEDHGDEEGDEMGGDDMDDMGDEGPGVEDDVPAPPVGKGSGRMPPPNPDHVKGMMHVMHGVKKMLKGMAPEVGDVSDDDLEDGHGDMGGGDMGDNMSHGDMDDMDDMDDEDHGDDMGGEGGEEGMDMLPPPKGKKGKKGPPVDMDDGGDEMSGEHKCAQCSKMQHMKKKMKKEAAEPWTKEDAEFLRSLKSQLGATQFKVNKDGWSEYQEDALLPPPRDPNADVTEDGEPGPGDVGYAPQGRVGAPLGGYEEWSKKYKGKNLNEGLRPKSRKKGQRDSKSWFGS